MAAAAERAEPLPDRRVAQTCTQTVRGDNRGPRQNDFPVRVLPPGSGGADGPPWPLGGGRDRPRAARVQYALPVAARARGGRAALLQRSRAGGAQAVRTGSRAAPLQRQQARDRAPAQAALRPQSGAPAPLLLPPARARRNAQLRTAVGCCGSGSGLDDSLAAILFHLRCAHDAPVFTLHQHRHGFELGVKIVDLRLVLTRKQFHTFFKLCLRRAYLLLKEAGTVLQVSANITHQLPP